MPPIDLAITIVHFQPPRKGYLSTLDNGQERICYQVNHIHDVQTAQLLAIGIFTTLYCRILPLITYMFPAPLPSQFKLALPLIFSSISCRGIFMQLINPSYMDDTKFSDKPQGGFLSIDTKPKVSLARLPIEWRNCPKFEF